MGLASQLQVEKPEGTGIQVMKPRLGLRAAVQKISSGDAETQGLDRRMTCRSYYHVRGKIFGQESILYLPPYPYPDVTVGQLYLPRDSRHSRTGVTVQNVWMC